MGAAGATVVRRPGATDAALPALIERYAMLTPGTLLQNRYRIIRQIGGGGMGVVYLAADTRLADKPRAIKELLPDPHARPEEREQAAVQFRREAAILAHLSHPNLPNVSDYFEQDGNFYLVMDYIEGETLMDRLARSPGGLPEQEVVDWAVQLCGVLDYLHSQNPPVIFRDMKPANVMVTAEGMVKLIDFGVARLFDPGKGTDTLKMGTAGYAPPEQYAGQGQTTPRSDIYSLGATIYQLLTGDDPTAHPFVFTPPNQLRRTISPRLSGVVMRALNLDPDARFPSARAMSQALREATRPRSLRLPVPIQYRRGTGTALLAETPAAPRRRSRPARIILSILGWIGRTLLTVTIALFIVVLLLLLGGSFAVSAVAERAIADTDWGLTLHTEPERVMTESDLEDGVRAFLEPYALDALGDVRADFRPPDKALISVELSSNPVSLEARLGVHDGTPVIILERVNDVPMYVIGGIISGGINRGFQKAFADSPLHVTSLVIAGDQLEIYLGR